MGFTKGMFLGLVCGAVIGYLNRDEMENLATSVMKKGKRYYRKYRHIMNMF